MATSNWPIIVAIISSGAVGYFVGALICVSQRSKIIRYKEDKLALLHAELNMINASRRVLKSNEGNNVATTLRSHGSFAGARRITR